MGTASIDYHLGELEAALDPSDPYHALPALEPGETRLLDVGCGIGQSLVALSADRGTDPDAARLSVGIDVEHGPLAHGRARFPGLRYAHARAESLPFADGAFDLVLARVSLPYTDIPLALAEAHRVLRPGGRLWCTLHPFALTREQFAGALRRRTPKDLAFRAFVIVNGAVFHVAGRTLRLPGTLRRESFQSVGGTRRALARAGFVDARLGTARPFVVTARRPAR